MISVNEVSITALSILLTGILVFASIDYVKKRKLKGYPFLTFIIPCYNSAKTIEETIKSVYNSYKSHKFELIVINDKSTDNTLEILKTMKNKFNFTIINNSKNLGKATSINNAYPRAKSEIIWIVDSDILVNKKAIEAVLARFQNNPKLVAVNCSYKMINKGFLAKMQQMECSMMSLLLLAHNHYSTLYLWGGCLAVKKSAFHKVGGFSKNMLTEDADLAFKLNEHKLHVEHSMVPVGVYSVDTLAAWYKEKMRWLPGTVQCYLKHVKVWIRHPFHVIFLILFAILSISAWIFLIRDAIFINAFWKDYLALRETTTRLFSLKTVGLEYGLTALEAILSKFYFLFFSVPYTIPMMKNHKEWYKVFYTIPFSLIYFPILSIIGLMSLVKGIWGYFCLKEDKRAW